jgi:hydroxypyruvate reductase
MPVDGVPLADKQHATRRLLAEGAEIRDLNCVRKHLSAIKGGRLAQACPGRVEAWLLSDVVGDDPGVIGSGPTVPDTTTYADALDVLDRHGGRSVFPPAIVRHLSRGVAGEIEETPKTADDLPRAATRVVAGQRQALDGAERAAVGLGYEVVRRATPVVGEARDAAAGHYAWLRERVGEAGRPLCVLSSGETTVRVTGGGKGGRNQEFALALVPSLAGSPWLVASVGTDGVDGPTSAAGAWADGSTATRAAAAGLDPIAYLHDNDAWSFFARLGGLIVSGPSDTNVGDVQVALAHPAAGPGER